MKHRSLLKLNKSSSYTSGLWKKMTYKGDSSLRGSTRLECPGRNQFDSETKSHIHKPCNKVRRLGEQQRSQVVYIFNIANTSWIWQVGWCSVEQDQPIHTELPDHWSTDKGHFHWDFTCFGSLGTLLTQTAAFAIPLAPSERWNRDSV